MTSSSFTPQERLESIKGGAVSGAVTLAASLLWNGGLVAAGLATAATALLLNVAVTTFCGFLFGVTYRYILRQDVRPHLKSGAVGAFALVRGLSQIEGHWRGAFDLLEGLPLLESFVVFTMAQLALDRAFQSGYLRPFKS